jgi:hypothetical protein
MRGRAAVSLISNTRDHLTEPETVRQDREQQWQVAERDRQDRAGELERRRQVVFSPPRQRTSGAEPMADDMSTVAGREFLLLGDGSLLRVVTEGGELVPWARYEARRADATARRCGCGRVCGSPSAQTCGAAECIASLRRQS